MSLPIRLCAGACGLAILSLLGAFSCAGAGGAGPAALEEREPAGRAGQAPTEATAEAISAFLKVAAYAKGSWASDSPTVREPSSAVSPHGAVRVWMNDLMVAALRAGKSSKTGTAPAHQLSMAIKELYGDDERVLLGHAVMLKGDEGAAAGSWVYYCYGPAGRCFTGSAERTIDRPYFGRGTAIACGTCHGGVVFAKPPAVGAAGTTGLSDDASKCKLATSGDGPIAQACAKGGIKKAKAVMKEMVKAAQAAGLKYDCDHCHKDDADYSVLTSDAPKKFDKLVAAAAKQ